MSDSDSAAPEVTGYDTRPDYRVDLLWRRNRVRVTHDGRLLAETSDSIVVDEQDHGLVVYVPATAVDWSLLVATDDSTRCPYKGVANYWRLVDGDAPVAWGYRRPYPRVAPLRDHVAFYQDRVSVQLGVADPAVSR